MSMFLERRHHRWLGVAAVCAVVSVASSGVTGASDPGPLRLIRHLIHGDGPRQQVPVRGGTGTLRAGPGAA